MVLSVKFGFSIAWLCLHSGVRAVQSWVSRFGVNGRVLGGVSCLGCGGSFDFGSGLYIQPWAVGCTTRYLRSGRTGEGAWHAQDERREGGMAVTGGGEMGGWCWRGCFGLRGFPGRLMGRGNDGGEALGRGSDASWGAFWIPACAGMTGSS